MANPSAVSVVIPAFNEQGAIAETVRETRRILEDADIAAFEVVVVDDGSSDDSARLADEAGARVIRHPGNIGYGRALKSGIREAVHDTIVITDADGTYPLEEIPRLVDVFSEGFDMVVGARQGQHYRGTWLKWPMRLILRFLVEWTTGRRIPDINSGLRVFSRKTVMTYLDHLSDTFSFTISVTLAYMMTARFVTYVPIAYRGRVGKSKVRLWRDSLRALQFLVQAITYYNPLKIFLLLSIICLLMAAFSIGFGLIFKVATALVLGAGAILVAIVVFALGLLAVLLRQILVK